MINVQISLPRSNKLKFETDCRQLDISIVPDIFADDALNSSTSDTVVVVSLLVSSSSLILNLFNILKSYREQKTYKIELVKNGVKISFDSKTPVEEIKNKLKELENMDHNEQ